VLAAFRASVIVLLLKLLLVPALIGAVTQAGQRWGPAVAGWLSGFPVVSAPVLLFLALEHGTDFTVQAATGTLSAVAVILVFGLSYAWTALRLPWLPALVTALLCYGLVVLLVDWLAPSLAAAAVLSSLALLAAPQLFPRPPALPANAAPRGTQLWLRMAAGALLVLLVTGFAARLGPRLSGMLAMFPVMASVLAAFSHRQSGAGFAILLLRGTVYGYYAFALFCLVLALALPRLGLAWGFGLALGGAGLVQAGSRLLLAAAHGRPQAAR
jgi:hypothetical protein